MSYPCVVYLENGRAFLGQSPFRGEGIGEAVFNTSMTGYQEIMTDPSYAGQCVAMTYPLIGNYGIHSSFSQSDKVHISALIVRRLSRFYSHYQTDVSVVDYLHSFGVPVIEKVDTRSLTLVLREHGAMKMIVSTEEHSIPALAKKLEDFPTMLGSNKVKDVTTSSLYTLSATGESRFKVVVIDCGVKHHILDILRGLGCDLTIVPAHFSAEQIMQLSPDGVFISNGPGDPSVVLDVQQTVRDLLDRLPLFGICLGHQIISLVCGARTFKLKFGHRGANHPVYDICRGGVFITSQNHGFCVDEKSLEGTDLLVSYRNLNDQTVSGVRHSCLPVYGVQFHPEASPGPRESQIVFNDFIKNMEDCYA